MTDAPERIWAFYAPEIAENNPQCTIVAGEHVMHGAQEYIRADLAMKWQPISTKDRLPEKINAKKYETVTCFIFGKYGWEIGEWDCEKRIWHVDNGVDLKYKPHEPSHWIPFQNPTPEGA